MGCTLGSNFEANAALAAKLARDGLWKAVWKANGRQRQPKGSQVGAKREPRWSKMAANRHAKKEAKIGCTKGANLEPTGVKCGHGCGASTGPRSTLYLEGKYPS